MEMPGWLSPALQFFGRPAQRSTPYHLTDRVLACVYEVGRGLDERQGTDGGDP